MPVISYYSQKEPAPDAEIWRFMDLRKFRDLMASEELYFRRADLFSDPSEGVPPEQYVERVLGLHPYDIKDQVALNNHLGSLAQSREMFFVSCWYLFKHEDLAIWEMYGHDGVAIRSRYDLLKQTLATMPDETHLGLIQYGPEHITPRFNGMEFITTKQKLYENECEVRAMLTSINPLDGNNRHLDLNNFPHPRPLDENPRHPWVHDHKRRRIILKDLVQEVIISPWADSDTVEEIELWTNHRGLGTSRDSQHRHSLGMTLTEYRDYHHIKQEPRPPEEVATERALQQFYDELMKLTAERVRWLYKQRWERCRFEGDGLPSTLDMQYLQVALRVLKDLK